MKSICTKIILGLAGKGLTLKERVIVGKKTLKIILSLSSTKIEITLISNIKKQLEAILILFCV